MKNFINRIKNWFKPKKLTTEQSLYGLLEANKNRFTDLFEYEMKGDIMLYVDKQLVSLTNDGENLREVLKVNKNRYVKPINNIKDDNVYKYKKGKTPTAETQHYIDEINRLWKIHEVTVFERLSKEEWGNDIINDYIKKI